MPTVLRKCSLQSKIACGEGRFMHNEELDTPYQILDPEGRLTGPLPEGLTTERLLQWYRLMYDIRFFSNKTVALQRQGRATTGGPLTGQAATASGTPTPLPPQHRR